MINLTFYLTIGAILFVLGIMTTLIRRNAVGVLMGIELILNAAALNFVAFSHFVVGDLVGHLFALFIIVIAAAEAVVALAIILVVFRTKQTIDVKETVELKC